MKHDVGKRGEPELVDPRDLVAAFLHTAERTHDRAVLGVRRHQRAGVTGLPRLLTPFDDRHDLVAGHSRASYACAGRDTRPASPKLREGGAMLFGPERRR